MLAILIDDDRLTTALLSVALQGLVNCIPTEFADPTEALAFLEGRAEDVGIVITDYDMPGLNGIEVVQAVRSMLGYEVMPVIMITSNDQRVLRRRALDEGATDFLTKPCDPAEVRARVQNLLRLRAAHIAERDRAAWLTREVAAAVRVIEEREREIVSLLMRAVEHRDTDTGHHIARVAGLVGLIADGLGLSNEDCRQLALAATMHDVGKVAVPDAILLKQGPLTFDERKMMETHADRGRRILESSSSQTIQLAAEIAASHHERWDGSGYPHGLAGEAIPLSGRIVAVADVYDALTSERPYKQAWSLEDARDYLTGNAGTHFDPACVASFVKRWPDVLALLSGFSDQPPVVAS